MRNNNNNKNFNIISKGHVLKPKHVKVNMTGLEHEKLNGKIKIRNLT